MRVATSPATRTGASNALPSRRAEERLGDIGRGADARRRRRHLEPPGAVATDRVDHAGERGTGQRPRVDVVIEREHEPGMVSASSRETVRVDERRRPPHRVRAVRALGAAAAPRALPQQRDHRAARGELDRPDRDPPEPAHARADAVADLTGAGRDQPTQHVADGRGERVGRDTSGQRDRGRAGSNPRSAHPQRRASP